MLSLQTLANEKFTNWISTEISPKKIKPFFNNLELAMSNLANGRVILKFDNYVLVLKKIFIV